MPRLTCGIAGIALAFTLVCPRPANAGLIDFIWEMSGPQMVGVPISCDFELTAPSRDQSDYECRVSEVSISGDRALRDRRSRFWLEVGGGVYISTGKNSEMREFGFGRVQLFAYEPMLHIRTLNRDSVKLTHGVMGLSYFLITGSDFKRFDNVGLKIVPVELTYKGFGIGYTLRVFPNGFTSEQFGVPSGTTTHQGREVVHGFVISLRR